MLDHSRNIAITGGTFTHNVGNSAFKELQKASAPSAFHNSSVRFDPPKCHPNTRVAVLEYLMGWIFGQSDPDALILWLYGLAGAGKSAILQTIAEHCFERKVLLASFFFGRADPTRNTFKPLVATIAYQIATTIPELKPHLESVIERDPLIFEKSIATQLQSLVVEPLKDLAASGFFDDPSNCARLVLIDGLDECNNPLVQSMILRALANVLRDENLPIIILIASRPEQHITLTFNSPPLIGLWRSLVLDDLYKPNEDIRLFLKDSFYDMKTTHPHRRLIPETWPEQSDVEKLVAKSSGQFIYSSLVVKYISAPVDRPPRRLEVIMGVRPARGDVPFAELDALYMHILSSCTNPDGVLSILGLFISQITIYTADIELYLDLDPGDVEIALAPLAAIIDVSDPQLTNQWIELRHASFSDFLLDISRSGPFHINTLSTMEHFIPKCISKLMNPYSFTCHIQPRQRLLGVLTHPFRRSCHDIPLVTTIELSLKGLSLPQLWLIWSAEPHGPLFLGNRVDVISTFLNFLSGHEYFLERTEVGFIPRPLGFSTIYAAHRSSFESIIKSEVPKYYQDVGLTSLLIVSIFLPRIHIPGDFIFLSLRLTDHSARFDCDSLCLQSPVGRDLLFTHYRYLFTGPRELVEVYPDGNKYAQVALRILEYLCDHSPHPIPYHKHPTLKPHSYRTGSLTVANRHSGFLARKMVQRIRKADGSFLRKRREEKHRHGVTLSIPDIWGPHPTIDFAEVKIREVCELGLLFLPEILERSSYSPELVAFIRRYGANIVFLPKTTRKAIRAMHEYLDRSDGLNMMD